MKVLMRTVLFLAVLGLCCCALAEGPAAEEIMSGRREVSYRPEEIALNGIKLDYIEAMDAYLWSPETPGEVRTAAASGFMNPQVLLEGELPDSAGIRENRTVGFVLYDQARYYRGKLALTTLPVIRLECAEEVDADYSEMRMSVWDNAKGKEKKMAGLIRLRGITARKFPKKSFRLSLKKEDNPEKKDKEALLGMRKDDDWILYPAYSDQEKIRNVFCTNLWTASCGPKNSKGVRNGNEFRYAELFVNGEYWGLYALGSPLDNKEMFEDGEDAVIYKKIQWSREMEDIEQDGTELPEYEISKATGKFEDDEDEAWLLLRDYYTFLRDNQGDSKLLLERIDGENFVHLAIFLNMIQGMDNYEAKVKIKNEFLCLTERGGKITSMMAPWDMDLTFGNDWSDDFSLNHTLVYSLSPKDSRPFFYGYYGQILLNGDTDLAKTVGDTYKALRADAWSDKRISALIDEYEAEIYGSGAFVRDRERWPEGTYNDPAEGLGKFKKYVLDRLKACDSYYQNMEFRKK